jgi:hypothetical protein
MGRDFNIGGKKLEAPGWLEPKIRRVITVEQLMTLKNGFGFAFRTDQFLSF